MKIAFLITAYHKSNQLINLVNLLGSKNGFKNIFIHLDKKSDINPNFIKEKTNTQIQIAKKYKVYWGGFNQLKSTLTLIDIAGKTDNYDFMFLLSGQDLPITSYNNIIDFLLNNSEKSFITFYKLPFGYWNYKKGLGRIQWFWFMDKLHIRGIQRLQTISHYVFDKLNIQKLSSKNIDFYGGSDWWLLSGNAARYCLKEFKTNKTLRNCFKYSFIPSEMYFQTTLNNSIYKKTIINDSKRYIYWEEQNNGHPNSLTFKDKDLLINSNCLFARKFDFDKDPEICNYFIENF